MLQPPSWATLSLAHWRPTDDPFADQRIVGFALLHVTRVSREDWRFVLDAEVAATLDDETELLRDLADRMPRPDFLIGEQIERESFTPLARAADRLLPPVNAWLRYRLARMQAAIPVDLAPPARRTPLPFAPPPQLRRPLLVADGTVMGRDLVRAELEKRAVDDWVRFLRLPMATKCGMAGVATETWLSARKAGA